jgi:small subunit ribosomal protein S17
MGKTKDLIGTVISEGMQKTRIVRIMRLMKHVKYGRIIKKYNKFKVHDEKNSAHIGDVVRVRECRPLSKEKRFRLIEIIKKAQATHIQLKEEALN